MIRVLVTGSNGLLGQKLTVLLDNDPEIDVVATARGTLNYPLSSGSFDKLDVTQREAVDHVITTHKPDVVIHTAAMTRWINVKRNKNGAGSTMLRQLSMW